MPTRAQILGSALDLLKAGRYAQSADLCRVVLGDDSRDCDALVMLGMAEGAQGRHEAALEALNDAVRLAPRHIDARREMARLLREMDRDDEAEAAFRAVLRLAPKDNATACAFGAYLIERGRPKEALAQAEAALAFDPNYVDAFNLRGGALAALGRLEEAVTSFRRATELNPDDPGAWSNLGTALTTLGRFDDALRALDDAARLAPEDPVIRVNRAMALLKAGWLEEGWEEWSWRHRQPGRPPLPAGPMLPATVRPADLAGRTIFVHHEEGFGDTIMFYRYVRRLHEAGARVLLRAPQPLFRLLRDQDHRIQMVTDPETMPPYDDHCPINSLPLLYEKSLDALSPQPAYLSADPTLVAHWAERLPSGPVRVGLVWAGEARAHDPAARELDRRRSLRLIQLESLLETAGAAFISLQAGPAARQLFAPLHDAMDGIADFADTAAIIAGLDLVISVDTAAAHLAGAMGKPVFLLDRFDNCWRWFSSRSDSPWYPGLRIFRQPAMGDWPSAIAAAKLALERFIAARADG